jgi:hypothetical protein
MVEVIRGIKTPLSVNLISSMEEGSGGDPSVLRPIWAKTKFPQNKRITICKAVFFMA